MMYKGKLMRAIQQVKDRDFLIMCGRESKEVHKEVI